MNEKGRRATSGFIVENVGSDWWTVGSHHPQDWWTHDRMRITRRQGRGYKRQAGRSPQVIPSPAMERQATQPTAVPSGRKRRRVSSSKKPKGDKEDMKATRELEMTLIGLPRAEAEDQAQAVERKVDLHLQWSRDTPSPNRPTTHTFPHHLTRPLGDGGHPERV